MGQYYKIFMCDEDGSNPRTYSSWEHDHNGAKLMEHSYYRNRFVEVALSQLVNNYWNKKPSRVWWVGDYAESNDISEPNQQFHPIENTWGCDEDTYLKVHNESFDFDEQLYLINLSTHEYVDLKKVEEQNKNEWGDSIHPLPLLTAVGNGRGGGDYGSSINIDMVGCWAGDVLQIVSAVPQNEFLVYVDISEDVYFNED